MEEGREDKEHKIVPHYFLCGSSAKRGREKHLMVQKNYIVHMRNSLLSLYLYFLVTFCIQETSNINDMIFTLSKNRQRATTTFLSKVFSKTYSDMFR